MKRLFLASAVCVLASTTVFAGVTEEDIANDATITTQVVTNGMGRHLQRFSPLKTINKDNVKHLVPAWSFSMGGEKQRGNEAQPLIYDGVMYVIRTMNAIVQNDRCFS